MATPPSSEKSSPGLKLHYGRIVVAVAFLTLAIGGPVNSTFAVFYVAMLEEFRWSRADTALAFSVSMLVFGVSATAVGALIDRFGPRKVIPAGAALLSLSLALTAGVREPWHLYLVYGVGVSLGITLIGFIPTSTVVAAWFRRRRATAMGVAMGGRGIGVLWLVPFSQYLIASLGWRQAYLILAALILATVVPLNALFQRGHPEAQGARPPTPLPDPQAAGRESGWNLSRAMRDLPFWISMVTGFVQGISFSAVMVHLVAHMVGVGYTKLFAAAALGTSAALRAAGGVAGGYLSDHVGRARGFSLCTAAALLGLFLLMAASGGERLLAWAFVLLYGLGSGGQGTIFVSQKADIFPGARFGSILGLSQVGTGLGAALGPWVAGWIYDRFESYYLALLMVAGAMALSAAGVWLTELASRRRKE